MTLPYPAFGEERISIEESHYKKDKSIPIGIAPAHTLEKLNHYLYRGKENFQ